MVRKDPVAHATTVKMATLEEVSKTISKAKAEVMIPSATRRCAYGQTRLSARFLAKQTGMVSPTLPKPTRSKI